jgi:hypothetical protein
MGLDPSSEPDAVGREDQPDPGQVQRRLRELPELHLVGRFASSSNATFLAWLGTHAPDRSLLRKIEEDPCWASLDGDGLLTVYKPRRGESPLWDFPSGTLCLREVAAHHLARELGWPQIPPTVLRPGGPFGAGSLQLFVDARPGMRHLDDGAVPEERWREIAAFDVLANNADRKGGHCLLDHEGTLWAIDHGLTFHVDPKLRTIFWEFAGDPLPRGLKPGLERAAQKLRGGRFARVLGRWLDRDELATLERRARQMLEPGWRFPSPRSRRAVPWPPV